MPRTIRIPRRDVGGGPATVLPSVEAAAAPAMASMQIGRAASGAALDVSRGLVGLGIQRQREQDALTYERELSRRQEELPAALAAADKQFADWAMGPDFSEAEVPQRYQDAFGGAFDRITKPTHQKLLARHEGERAGLLAADTTALLEEIRKRRDSNAIDDTITKGVRYAQQFEPHFLALMGDAANDTLDMITRPELSGAKAAARERIFNAILDRHIAAGGADGELQFRSELADGAYDRFGERALEERAKSVGRAHELLKDKAKDALLDNDYGQPTPGGGRFGSFDAAPNLKDLQALKEDLDWLPEGERQQAFDVVDSLMLRRAARADAMDSMERWFRNPGTRLDLRTNPERRAAFDTYANEFVKPWLERRDVPWREKSTLLREIFQGVGYAPPSIGTWVKGAIERADQDPDLVAAVALAVKSLGPGVLQIQRPRLDRGEAEAEAQGLLDVNLQDGFSDEDHSFLLTVADNLDMGTGTAVQLALDQREAGRAASGRAGKGGAAAGGGFTMQEALAPTREQEEAREEASELLVKLRERLQEQGQDVDEVGASMLGTIEDLAASEYKSRSWMTDTDTRMKDSLDSALRQTLQKHRPVSLFGHTYFSKNLYDTLEPDGRGGTKYDTRMLEMEVAEFLEQNGKEIEKGDLLDRVRIYDPPVGAAEPNEFIVHILGDPDERTPPETMKNFIRFDGATSAQTRARQAAQLAGLDERLSAVFGKLSVPGAAGPPRLSPAETLTRGRQELLRAFLLSGEEQERYFGALQSEDTAETLDFREALDLAQGQKTAPFQGGQPLFMRSPALRAEFQRAYDAAWTPGEGGKGLSEAELGSVLMRGFLLGRGRDTTKQRFARQVAEKAVMDMLVQEFKVAPHDEIIRTLMDGLLPSERQE